MNKKIWKGLMCFALCALTFSLASCGDDDDNTNTPETVTPSNQNGSQTTASIVGNWGLDGVKDYIFFNADGTGGFMEYSTSSNSYHQDGAFRWVQNADGTYSFSGAGLHDGVHYMAIESYDGNTMVVNIQFEGDDKVEHLILRRLSSNPNTTPSNPAVVTVNVVGNWDVVKEIRSYYRNGAWESEDKSKSGPYDYIFFSADGTGGYMEYGGSDYHQDGEFRWTRNADGSYTFSGEGLHHGVYSMAIKKVDSNDKMEVEVYWSTSKKSYYTLQRQVQ